MITLQGGRRYGHEALLIESLEQKSATALENTGISVKDAYKTEAAWVAGVGLGTGEGPVQVQHRPQYRVWTGRWRGTSSPPGHCQGGFEQGTEPLTAKWLYHLSPLCMCIGPVCACLYFSLCLCEKSTTPREHFCTKYPISYLKMNLQCPLTVSCS